MNFFSKKQAQHRKSKELREKVIMFSYATDATFRSLPGGETLEAHNTTHTGASKNILPLHVPTR